MASDNSGGLPGAVAMVTSWARPPRAYAASHRHSIPIDPKQLRHLAAGVGLLSLEQIEGLQTRLSLGLAFSCEEPSQLLRRFVDRRDRLFHGDRLQLPLRLSCGSP
jgi:hypothetical protein